MNTRLTFLTVAALALLAPPHLLAQAKDEAKPPPPSGEGRQAIIYKLDRIRLDTVNFDLLPLSEVVICLRDEATKRDPEKKGINFMLNPNPPAEAAPVMPLVLGPDGRPLPALPPEQVDIGSVAVRINPPLSDVRLVDVLDAVVKVADCPIKYSVEDYGVVFSLRGAEPARKEEVNSPVRQAIINKLDRTRLDAVRFDGLPLAEVVILLRDEARKHDPEKKGINFMLNPNPPAEAAPVMPPALGPDGRPLPAPPPEQVDIGSIAVRINPPLAGVRLVDVLNAVVKVAERPIKYSVENYGVVFSLRGSEPAREDEIAFAFPGGTPSQFLDAVQQQCKVDWLSVADIPEDMAYVRIPRLRIPLWTLQQLAGGGRTPLLQAIISLYNQLGEQKPELGRLIVKDDLTKPSVVMFVPDKDVADTQPKVKVKAFSIYGIKSDVERAKLEDDIERAKSEAAKYASRVRGPAGSRSLEGTVAIHNQTSLLVATGTEAFVDMVESIVNAYGAMYPPVPTALPGSPTK